MTTLKIFFRFILRNHLAQDCIESVEKNDFLDSKILLTILESPFSIEPIETILKNIELDEEHKQG